jgi:hypothetical protein
LIENLGVPNFSLRRRVALPKAMFLLLGVLHY